MKLFPIAPEEGLQRGDEAAHGPWKSNRLLSEPLLHFLIVGAALFGVYHIANNGSQAAVDTQKIELTQDDVRQLAVTWLAQGRPQPTPDELRSLVDQKVTEEILFREAVALGLDRDDEIIKRRLAQKMDFLAADLAAMNEPSNAELKDWFSRKSERFALPAHMNFRHLYFSPDKRGDGARDAAAAALALIAGKPVDSPEVASVADPFMFRNYYGDSTPEQTAKEFGPDFAATLFTLKPGSWQGPVQSGYGWHLVWIDSIEPGRIPAFEEVEPDVKSAWVDDRYREVKRVALEEMRSRYTVVVPALDSIDLQDLKSPQAAGAEPEAVSQ
jgi:peptidyl-prolyl cis-trans isomerase C